MEPSKTIIFISGAFSGNTIWDNWNRYFRTAGYKVYNPWWPHKDAPASVIRKKHPDSELAALRLHHLVSHFKDYLGAFPEKPIIVGEGLGGTIVQLLLGYELASAGVIIQPWTPGGFFPVTFRSFVTFFKILCPVKLKRAYLASVCTWTGLLTPGLSKGKQKEVYNQYAVPESRKLLWDVLLGTKMDYCSPHAPLLCIAQENSFISANNQHRNFNKYSDKNSLRELNTSFDKFPSMIEQGAALDIPDYIHSWITALNKSGKLLQ